MQTIIWRFKYKQFSIEMSCNATSVTIFKTFDLYIVKGTIQPIRDQFCRWNWQRMYITEMYYRISFFLNISFVSIPKATHSSTKTQFTILSKNV